MTSKISYSKFIRENIRRRGWLLAVSMILMFSMQTLWTAMRIETLLSGSAHSPKADVASLENLHFAGFLNGLENPLFAVLVVLLALCCAVSGFSYLHRSEETDFFHSLPLARRQLFLISYTGGLILFLVPYLLACIGTIATAYAMGIGSCISIADCLLSMLGCILGFLILYQAAIVAMMLTGKLISGILAAIVLYVYTEMIASLSNALPSHFFDTYHASAAGSADLIRNFLSPIGLYSHLYAQTGWFEGTDRISLLLSALFAAAVWIVLTWVAAYFLYQKRGSETAGTALSYPFFAGWIKFFAAVPASLTLGLFVASFYGNNSDTWVILISLLSVVLLCGITEFIYHTDLKQVTHGKVSSFLSIVTVAGILVILHFDLFGYNTWLPKESELKSIAFTADSFSNYFTYYNDGNGTKSYGLLDEKELQVTAPDPLLALAKDGVQNYKNGIKTEDIYEEYADDYMQISIRFTPKYGMPVYRDYAVSKNAVLDSLETLCKNETYRKNLFPVFQLDTDKVSEVKLTDIYQVPQTLSLSSEQKTELFHAYEQDILKTDIRILQTEYPIAELTAEFPTNYHTGNDLISEDSIESVTYLAPMSQMYIYENFTNTLDLLSEYGYTIRREIALSDVQHMDLESNLDESEPTTLQAITDPEEMQDLLDQLHYPCPGILGGKDLPRQYIELSHTAYPYPIYYPLV